MRRHGADDPITGTPLCLQCYDYNRAALWNGAASLLWADFAKRVRRHIASAQSVPRTRLADHVRVSFVKVKEYQRRGAIHLHAVIRFDGPGGPGQSPPDWAGVELLVQAVRSAAASALITTVEPDGSGVLRLRFGVQLDVQPIVASADGDGLTEEMVAAYIAKYVSKGDLPGVVLDVPVRSRGHIGASRLNSHGKALMFACWDLGERPEYAHLRAWAHQLGWRGHPTTKTPVYSTTYGRLRGDRAEHRRAANGEDFDPDQTITESSWVFDSQGHTPGQAMFAAGIADDIAAGRAANRQARDEIERGEAGG